MELLPLRKLLYWPAGFCGFPCGSTRIDLAAHGVFVPHGGSGVTLRAFSHGSSHSVVYRALTGAGPRCVQEASSRGCVDTQNRQHRLDDRTRPAHVFRRSSQWLSLRMVPPGWFAARDAASSPFTLFARNMAHAGRSRSSGPGDRRSYTLERADEHSCCRISSRARRFEQKSSLRYSGDCSGIRTR